MPAQALHAIEQTRLQLVVVALGFAGCPSAAAAPLCFRLTCDRHNQSDWGMFLVFFWFFLVASRTAPRRRTNVPTAR